MEKHYSYPQNTIDTGLPNLYLLWRIKNASVALILLNILETLLGMTSTKHSFMLLIKALNLNEATDGVIHCNCPLLQEYNPILFVEISFVFFLSLTFPPSGNFLIIYLSII